MFTVLSGVSTGFGLFLLGMRFLTKGLRQITSSRLKNTIKNLGFHPILGVLVGIIATALLQSSSGTTIIVVGLVEAQLLTLHQAASIIMGANIGTTVTAQLIAFHPNKYIFLPLLIGLILSFHKTNKNLLFWGETLLGFSLIFIGMDLLSKAISPLQHLIRFQEILLEFGKRPTLGVVIGFCTTAILQSSSTGVAILQSLASNKLLPLSAAVAILLGQNIGTCVTTLLSSIHLSAVGKRAAFIHLLFNVLGVLMVFPFMEILCAISQIMAPANAARQIAHAHSLFNIFSTIIFIPFISIFVKLSNKIIKE
ncbi:Na/Pi cotransporter family protein [Clostridium formicaceticum]|uniref:Na+/Pi-cotransporter n=1 Tax=Clostridium formicaceticum TaxID=1497 RepID=A0AAC9RID0_9CLOT|nr:Na/Pi symporter [Clostridium formicaceticum]AOY76226.1 sodium:phosphate symporter [Clostridium formicaceticum]ARE86606.1 Na+/Pi-cotransporter [Clostridium formicaceticum]